MDRLLKDLTRQTHQTSPLKPQVQCTGLQSLQTKVTQTKNIPCAQKEQAELTCPLRLLACQIAVWSEVTCSTLLEAAFSRKLTDERHNHHQSAYSCCFDKMASTSASADSADTTQTIIVGAGIVGSCLAALLSTTQRVVLVDRSVSGLPGSTVTHLATLGSTTTSLC